MAKNPSNDETPTSGSAQAAATTDDGAVEPVLTVNAEGNPEFTTDVQTAQSQTKINAAPTYENTAADPRPVETRNQPLVYANGDVVTRPDAGRGGGTFRLRAPGGNVVTVVGTARRDTFLGRGYTLER